MSHTTQPEAVLSVVRDNPGSTGAELYQFFDADTWDREQVFKLLVKLHKAGMVRREGEGGKMEPFRYFAS